MIQSQEETEAVQTNDMKESDKPDENIENNNEEEIKAEKETEGILTEEKNKDDLKEDSKKQETVKNETDGEVAENTPIFEDKMEMTQTDKLNDQSPDELQDESKVNSEVGPEIVERNEKQESGPTETIEPIQTDLKTNNTETETETETDGEDKIKKELQEEPEKATDINQTTEDAKDDSEVQPLKSKDEDTELKIETKQEKPQNGSIPLMEEGSGSEASDGVEVIEEQEQESSQQATKAEFHPGVLELTVHRARHLVNNDTFSKSDPYVKLRFNTVEFRSKTISNNLNPEWNFSAHFDILNEDEKYIHINVYDDDFGTDNIQGCFSLPLELAMNQLTEAGQWFSLVGCESGEIFLSSQFTKVKMEDRSTEKPVQITDESSIDTKTLEKAEQLVSNIVEKAEKVVNEVEAKLEKDSSVGAENDLPAKTETKEETFREISKGSQEVIEKIVEKIDKNKETEIKIDETNKTISSPLTENKTETDSFREIEKESKDVVEKIESSMKETTETSADGPSEALMERKPEDKISSDEKDEGENTDVSGATDITAIQPTDDEEKKPESPAATEPISSEEVSPVKTGVPAEDEENVSQVQKTEIDSVKGIVPGPEEDPSNASNDSEIAASPSPVKDGGNQVSPSCFVWLLDFMKRPDMICDIKRFLSKNVMVLASYPIPTLTFILSGY